jgi:dTMP kinase
MFITFEGIDLSGKSTQAKLLYDYLRRKKRKVILVREPGGTPTSEKIRDILLDKSLKKMLSLTEFLLFSASRHQLTEEVIKPHLKKGYFVICDRYYDSSTAYQGYGGKIEMGIIKNINTIASNKLNPDVTFFVDIDMKESAKRRYSMKKTKDRMESKKVEYFNKVIKGYRELSRLNNRRFVLLNGKKTIEELQNDILNILRKKNKNV